MRDIDRADCNHCVEVFLLKQPSHRCPECWQTFYRSEAVDAHRVEKQGECFDRLPRWQQHKIEHYRKINDVTPPPLPAPKDEFDVIEE